MKLVRAILMFVVACFVITGCGDDEPSRPRITTGNPTISNIWPNDDGRAWTYAYTQRIWDWAPTRHYPTEEEVPPLPTMDELAAILGSHPIGRHPDTILEVYRLQFVDSITTASGVTAQYLKASLSTPQGGPSAVAQVAPEQVFLNRLMMARPDLRGKIAAYLDSRRELELPVLGSSSRLFQSGPVRSAAIDSFERVSRNPLLLHGYAWRKTDTWIGTYGDIDTLLAWKFLEWPLTSGHEFTHQLVPGLADDVFEHCRILPSLSVQTEAGLFCRTIECLYVIDYGVLCETDLEGNPIGYLRFFDYGTVVYAPTVGPVYSYERMLVEPGDPLTTGLGDLTLSLVGTGVMEY
jgi:hypothetical protein